MQRIKKSVNLTINFIQKSYQKLFLIEEFSLEQVTIVQIEWLIIQIAW